MTLLALAGKCGGFGASKLAGSGAAAAVPANSASAAAPRPTPQSRRNQRRAKAVGERPRWKWDWQCIGISDLGFQISDLRKWLGYLWRRSFYLAIELRDVDAAFVFV